MDNQQLNMNDIESNLALRLMSENTSNNKFIGNELNTRAKVFKAEELMLQMPQRELEVKHYFSQGVYARELYIPKDTILVGKLHKYKQLNILSKGDISVLIDEEVKRIQAPFTVVSSAGTKRIAYTHEDSVWLTIHGTEETDIDLIEDIFTASSEQDYLDFISRQLRLPL